MYYTTGAKSGQAKAKIMLALVFAFIELDFKLIQSISSYTETSRGM